MKKSEDIGIVAWVTELGAWVNWGTEREWAWERIGPRTGEKEGEEVGLEIEAKSFGRGEMAGLGKDLENSSDNSGSLICIKYVEKIAATTVLTSDWFLMIKQRLYAVLYGQYQQFLPSDDRQASVQLDKLDPQGPNPANVRCLLGYHLVE